MIINAYDTTAGAPFKLIDKITGTIKTLALMDALVPTTKEGVFVITYGSDVPVPIFAFPITLQSHTRELITVYDERPYRNKSNVLTNAPEAEVMRLCAFLQHDVASNNTVPLKNGRALATRSFAGALGNLLGRRGGLDVMENLHLKMVLAFYYVCLSEKETDDYHFVASTVIHDALGADKNVIENYTADLPFMSNIKDLIKVIVKIPGLYKLRTLDLRDFLGLAARISFSAVGKHVVNASLEAPCLFTALIYGTVNNQLYAKTPLGIQLDPKYNERILQAFRDSINFTYDLKVK